MKHFIQSFVTSAFLSALVYGAFAIFSQETFFTPTINLITELCMLALLVVIWYLFALDVWNTVRKKDCPSQPSSEPAKASETPAQPEQPDVVVTPKADNEPIIVADNGPVVFIPPQPPEPKPEPAPQPDANRRLTPAEKKALREKQNQERAAKRAEKLQQAAQQKQEQRARKQQEDAERQKKKLERLKAEAAQKKANSASKNNQSSDDAQ